MNGNEIVLDTSAAIRLLNNRASARRILTLFSREYLPVIAVGELIYGALNSSKQAENLRKYRAFIDRCVILNATEETAEIYARIRLHLKHAGHPIPESDIWIAAAAIERSTPLLTTDAHFASVPDLTLHPTDWTETQ